MTVPSIPVQISAEAHSSAGASRKASTRLAVELHLQGLPHHAKAIHRCQRQRTPAPLDWVIMLPVASMPPPGVVSMAKSLRADLLKRLVAAHAEGDQEAFRKAALQVASAESMAGHLRIAEQIREIVARLQPSAATSPKLVDIAQPRGPLADILDGGHRDERLRDIVLTATARSELEQVILENRSRPRLESFGVAPRRLLLFHGPPGCGKTLAASVMAGELRLPLITVRVDALFSRFLGATALHLRAIFAEMPRRPGVYLFDEFDAVAKARGHGHDVGEMQRIVTSFLQLLDSDRSHSVLIAATNHSELLDRAMFRRFDLILHFERPTQAGIKKLLSYRLATFGLSGGALERVARQSKGLSYADVVRGSDDAIRAMALADRSLLTETDLLTALKRVRSRSNHARPKKTRA